MKGEYGVFPCALDHFRRWCSSTWWGPHIICAVHAVVISRKTPLYDCIGWLFSQLEHDGCANGFLNASHSFNVFLILVFQFLGWKKNNNTGFVPQNAGRVVTLHPEHMQVNVFLLSASHIGIIFHIGLMLIFTFKAIIGRFLYWSDNIVHP